MSKPRRPSRKTKPKSAFSDKDHSKFYKLKEAGMTRVLGPMYELVGHAIVPFQVGGPVDMYRFPNAIEGTAFATLELIEPDGLGPLPANIGMYELIAFTSRKIDDRAASDFNEIELRIRHILTSVARLSYEEILNPGDTCEVPGWESEQNQCLVLGEWKTRGKDFRIGRKKYGLLLCMEIFRSEMEFAMRFGSGVLLEKLKKSGFYPYSDLDRNPVA